MTTTEIKFARAFKNNEKLAEAFLAFSIKSSKQLGTSVDETIEGFLHLYEAGLIRFIDRGQGVEFRLDSNFKNSVTKVMGW